jgi:peptidoglycan/xylan/chitin deacetylase (PgdA/CDA1 family)
MTEKVVNLTFHGIGTPPHRLEPSEAKVWISRDRFAETLDAAAGRSDVRISFDDGNRSDVEIALPALVEKGMTATFFVLAGRLDAPGYVDPDDVRTLIRCGMTVGSHGMHHRDWRRLSDAELDEELGTARTRLADIAAAPVTAASVPFGSYDRRVLARLRRDGHFTRVYTSDGGVARAGAWLQPRTSLTDEDASSVPRLDASRGRMRAAVPQVKRLVKRWR